MAPGQIRALERAARDLEGLDEHLNALRALAVAHRAIRSILFPVRIVRRIRSGSRSPVSPAYYGMRPFRVHRQVGINRHPRPTEQLPNFAQDQLHEPKVRHDKLDSPLS